MFSSPMAKCNCLKARVNNKLNALPNQLNLSVTIYGAFRLKNLPPWQCRHFNQTCSQRKGNFLYGIKENKIDRNNYLKRKYKRLTGNTIQ